VYVQHIIPQHASHISAAISNGACIVVCGAAQQMPKAVFAAISEALASGSNMSVEDAEKVLQGMRIVLCYSS
jgi:sulfite reductase alpha subunit-like flavoprotein